MPFYPFKQAVAVVLLSLLFCVALPFLVLSQEDLSQKCEWDKIEQAETALPREDFQNLLEQCKAYYESKSNELGQGIEENKAEEQTLKSQISRLGSKIQSLQYQISQSNVMVKGLTSQINDTQVSISKTEEKISAIKEKLAGILQLRYEEDSRTMVEIFLTEESLSDFFDNLVALEMLNAQAQDFLTSIKALKSELESQYQRMDTEKRDLENVVVIQTLQKEESAKSKKDQEYFLKLNEIEYQQYLTEKKEADETAVKIGNLLFELLEVPEGGIKFEDAARIAQEVSKQTGVRAAFSLAVLWQETRIGQLKGGCYLENTKTGNGVYIRTGNTAPRTMSPSRDVPPFLEIISSLNQAGKLNTNAFATPVSCCMIRDGSYFGWGGAMGPAQFIPSTWVLFKQKIEEKTGSVPANPWNVRDSFLANSLYLADLGADSQTYSKEIYAALRYFGCTSSWCRTYYGEPVMKVAACLQGYIESGSMSSSCRNLIF